MNRRQRITALLDEYRRLGIAAQVDYEKFYLYSIITHSTAIEGSTVTETENLLLFDEGIAAKGRSMVEQLMNLDLKKAYEHAFAMAHTHEPITIDVLKELSALVMKNTGSEYSTLAGTFDSSKGDLRLVNVTAGAGGRSYMNYLKVPARLSDFCQWLNAQRNDMAQQADLYAAYAMSFEAHLRLVTIHPWVDGNGRMARLVMNMLQAEQGLMPTKVYSDEKAEYIQALVDARQQDSPEPFVNFMFDAFARNLTDEMEQFRKSMADDAFTDASRWTETTQQVDKNGTTGGQKTRAAIVSMMAQDPAVTTAAMAKSLGINRSALSKHIRLLQDLGIISRQGAARGGRWMVHSAKFAQT